MTPRDTHQFRTELGLGLPPADQLASAVALAAGVALPALGCLLPVWPAGVPAMIGTLAASAGLVGAGLGLQRQARGSAQLLVDPAYDDGIVVGIREDGRPMIWPTREQVWHGLLVGKPGSGKTVQLMSMAFAKILRGGSVIFIDAKPSERNLRLFLWMMQKTGRLDDFRALLPATPMLSHTFNPLQEGDDEAQTSLLTSLRRFKGDSSTEHYQDIHDDVTAAVIGVLRERRQLQGEHYHWGDVLAALSSEQARDELLAGKLTGAKSHLASMLRRYLLPDGELNYRQYFFDVGGVITLLRKYVRSASSRILLVERGEIDLYDLISRRGVLYVAVPTGSASKSAWSWALLVAKCLTAAVARLIQEGRAPREPALACLDELKAYLTDEIALAFAQWREGGVGVVAGIQSISQMRSGVDELDAQILDNTAMKQFFAAAGWDGAEAAAKQVGKNMQLTRTYSSGQSSSRSSVGLGIATGSRGRSENVGARETWHYQVEPIDIMELPVGMCYHRWGGGFARVRTPLFTVPEEELPPISDLERLRYPSAPVDGIGLWERYQRDVMRDIGRFLGEDSDA